MPACAGRPAYSTISARKTQLFQYSFADFTNKNFLTSVCVIINCPNYYLVLLSSALPFARMIETALPYITIRNLIHREKNKSIILKMKMERYICIGETDNVGCYIHLFTRVLCPPRPLQPSSSAAAVPVAAVAFAYQTVSLLVQVVPQPVLRSS